MIVLRKSGPPRLHFTGTVACFSEFLNPEGALAMGPSITLIPILADTLIA